MSNTYRLCLAAVAQPDICNGKGTPSGGPPNFPNHPTPQFQYSPLISATSLCKYDETFLCKILQKNAKFCFQRPHGSRVGPLKVHVLYYY